MLFDSLAKELLQKQIWRVEIAGLLKKRHLSANSWISERLNVGATSAVSRNVASMFAAERGLALLCYEKLISKVNS